MLPYWPAVALAFGALLRWQTHSQSAIPLAIPLDSVMATVEGYRVIQQKLTAEEERVAGMTSYVARVYVKDSVPAFTTLVSYYDRQTQGKTIHSPRNCLPGAGWEVVSAGTTTVTMGDRSETVNRYLIRNGPATALAFYWYQGRGRITANEYRVKWNLLRDAAALGHTEEALVRIVVPIPSAARANPAMEEEAFSRAYGLAQEVARTMMMDMARVLPRVSQGS